MAVSYKRGNLVTVRVGGTPACDTQVSREARGEGERERGREGERERGREGERERGRKEEKERERHGGEERQIVREREEERLPACVASVLALRQPRRSAHVLSSALFLSLSLSLSLYVSLSLSLFLAASFPHPPSSSALTLSRFLAPSLPPSLPLPPLLCCRAHHAAVLQRQLTSQREQTVFQVQAPKPGESRLHLGSRRDHAYTA